MEIVDVTKDSITLRWSSNKFADAYFVGARYKSTGPWESKTIKSTGGKFESYTFGNLKENENYSVSVRSSPVGSKATVLTAVTNPGEFSDLT